MRTAAIISEFNPLHAGHKYVIDFARNNLRADRLIIIMSGNFTQRGTPSVIEKYERAKTAVRCGADLCIELPVIAAVSSAEVFAETGVSLACKAGADDIVFGAENAYMDAFKKTAALLSDETEDFKAALKNAQRDGASYPSAMKKALEMTGQNCLLLDNPNDMLGLMYAKAAENKDIALHAVKRTGSGHAIRAISYSGFSSSLSIRNAIKDMNIASALSSMPLESGAVLEEKYNRREIINEDDLSELLHMKLYETDDFSHYLDINEDISNRIVALRDEFKNFSSFAEALKTKNITFARIERCLIHIILGLSCSDLESLKSTGFSPYIHILSMNENGSDIIKNIKDIPVFASLSERKDLSKEAEDCLKKDIFASDLYRILLTEKTGRTFKREFSRRFEIENGGAEFYQ